MSRCALHYSTAGLCYRRCEIRALLYRGFSENGSDEGKRLETEMVSVIGKSGTRLLGPNCMAFIVPKPYDLQ